MEWLVLPATLATFNGLVLEFVLPVRPTVSAVTLALISSTLTVNYAIQVTQQPTMPLVDACPTEAAVTAVSVLSALARPARLVATVCAVPAIMVSS